MAQPTNRPEQFFGSWSLIDWRIEYNDGKITLPFGENAIGQILYTRDYGMSAAISRGSRSKLNQSNARNAGDAQKAEGFDSYFHYAGHWSLQGDEVVHYVSLSLNPDMVGTQQIRTAEFEGHDNLILSALEPLASGGQRHHILQWTKRSRE